MMMRNLKYFFGIMLMACIPFTANAQFAMFGGGNRVNMDSLRRITAADYADMLAKVGVRQPREVASLTVRTRASIPTMMN